MFRNEKFEDKWLWGVFLFFLAITLWGLITHTPWRDEAQAWLIVRDLNLSEILKQMSYEGTPPLWHLVLFPFAKLGFPYTTALIIHYLIAVASVFIFLFYSPFPKNIKLIIPLTYYFLFEYTIVARNYNLSALLLFAIAAFYKQRFKYPVLYSCLIFLLAWTNIHSFAIALILLVYYIYDLIKRRLEGNRFIVAASIMVIGLISVLLILIPQTDQYTSLAMNPWKVFPKSLASALIPFFNNNFIPTFYLTTLALLWIPIVFLILKSWKIKIIFITSYLWLLFIFLFKHAGDTRHYGLILILFLFVWWLEIARTKKQPSNRSSQVAIQIFSVCLLLSSFYAFQFYFINLNKTFSGAKEMADYIKENQLDKEEMATFPSYSGTALLPYLPNKEFYQMETIRKGTFMTWDKTFAIGNQLSYFQLKEYMKAYYRAYGINKVMLLTTIPEGTDPELKLIIKNSKQTVKTDEYFYLYWLEIKY